MMRVEFVGGPQDGLLQELPEHALDWIFATPKDLSIKNVYYGGEVPTQPLEMKYHRYVKYCNGRFGRKVFLYEPIYENKSW